MKNKSTLKERVFIALTKIGRWSTSDDVYNYMVENNIDVGKSQTPNESVSSALSNMHNKDGKVLYRKDGKEAGQYGLPNWEEANDSLFNTSPVASTEKKDDIKERDLHQLLCNYLYNKGEYPKTIYQERSNRNDTNQKWVHPDMVSASFVTTKTDITRELLKTTKTNEALQLYSYELKIRIRTDYDLKQAYFQALSNSHWANYGYLVSFEIADNKDMVEEMERLNQSYGIGIIQLGITPQQTRVLYPARKKELDYKTIDKLCDINPEFKSFVEQVTLVISASDKRHEVSLKLGLKNICDDKIEEHNDIIKYCKQKNIPVNSDTK